MYSHTYKLVLMDGAELDDKAKDLNVRIISSVMGIAVYLDSEDEEEARSILKRPPAVFITNEGGKLVVEKADE